MTVYKSLKHSIKNFFHPKAVILMYHQVCERKSDPWELAVSPERFEEQVSFLKNNFDVVPLEELASSVVKKNIGTEKVAITFDDGFLDNFTNARPILESHSMPATFYMATQAMQDGRLYWWDELEQIIFHTPQLPRELTLEIGGSSFYFKFSADEMLTVNLTKEIMAWNAWMLPTNERLSLFMKLWKSIQRLPHKDQCNLLNQLKAWSGIDLFDLMLAPVMELKELTELSLNPLFAIGAHTVNHAMLAEQEVETQAFEIHESKNVIEGWLGRKVNGFAYPYGNYNAVTKRLLKDAGFSYAVSTENRVLTDKDDLFELPRVQVKNWNKKEFAYKLNQLLTNEKE